MAEIEITDLTEPPRKKRSRKEVWVKSESNKPIGAKDVEDIIFQDKDEPFCFFRKLVLDYTAPTRIKQDPFKILFKCVRNLIKHHTDKKTRAVKSNRNSAKKFWATGTGYGGSYNKTASINESSKKKVTKKNNKDLALLTEVLTSFSQLSKNLSDEKTYSYDLNIRLVQYLSCKGEYRQKIRGKDRYTIIVYDSFIELLTILLRNNSIVEISSRLPFYNTLLALINEMFKISTIRFLLFVPFPMEFHRKQSTIFGLLKDLSANLDTSFYANLDQRDVQFLEKVKSLTSSMDPVYFKLNTTYISNTFAVFTEPDVNDAGIAILGTSVSKELEAKVDALTLDSGRRDRRQIIKLCLRLTDTDDQSALLRKKAYCKIMKSLCFKAVEIRLLAQNRKLDYAFFNQATQNSFFCKKRMLRIARELTSLANSLPIAYRSSVIVRVDETQNDMLCFLIIGPNNTPYEHGIYIFDCYFNSFYPNEPPKVLLKTTGNGTVRFNPNLYANGKVCLSLLGTWSGPSWSPTSSTLLQVLVSIQSLIFVDDPFFNEPGYESQIGTSSGEEKSRTYNEAVIINNLRFAIYANIVSPHILFKEVILSHFTLKARDICNTLNIWEDKYNSKVMLKYIKSVRGKLDELAPTRKMNLTSSTVDLIGIEEPTAAVQEPEVIII